MTCMWRRDLRYFTNENTCLGFCDAGVPSNASNASDYTLFAGTVVGECLDCPKGEIGRTDVETWPETCTKCLPGEYSDPRVQQSVQHVRNITFPTQRVQVRVLSVRQEERVRRIEQSVCHVLGFIKVVSIVKLR